MTLNVRKNEFQADRYATGLGYADGLQRGLIKITSENLGTLDPPRRPASKRLLPRGYDAHS